MFLPYYYSKLSSKKKILNIDLLCSNCVCVLCEICNESSGGKRNKHVTLISLHTYAVTYKPFFLDSNYVSKNKFFKVVDRFNSSAFQ